ncbi:unnamed protein product [Echinostoma caproni]|uniref:Peptidase A2 domain-containing protein n=1 Tax=Echinostoma caproni TaxID=27848 RepID=A0A183BED8_9TREM|nr:unnamed protein product [Echinostoma caproni]
MGPTAACSIPEKNNVGDNFQRWKKQVKIYLENFSPERHPNLALSLLGGEAFDVVTETNCMRGGVTAETFACLRRLLDSPLLPMEYKKQLNARHQYDGEGVRSFVRELRRLASRAWENDSPPELEKKLLEQLVEGSRSNNVRRHLLINPPSDLEVAVKRAEDVEKLEAATVAPRECLAVRYDGAQEVGHQAWQRGREMRPPWRPNYRFQHRPLAHQHNRKFNYSGRQPGEFKQNKTLNIPTVCCQSNSQDTLMIELTICNLICLALIDTGASRSLIKSSVMRQLKGYTVSPCFDRLTAANGAPISILRTTVSATSLTGRVQRHPMIIAEDIRYEVILGMDVLCRWGCTLDLNNWQLVTPTLSVPFVIRSPKTQRCRR